MYACTPRITLVLVVNNNFHKNSGINIEKKKKSNLKYKEKHPTRFKYVVWITNDDDTPNAVTDGGGFSIRIQDKYNAVVNVFDDTRLDVVYVVNWVIVPYEITGKRFFRETHSQDWLKILRWMDKIIFYFAISFLFLFLPLNSWFGNRRLKNRL